ncbi:response regulator [Paenibacillus sp. P25]|nr:response regulator [Paenibacillus sp. P25]
MYRVLLVDDEPFARMGLRATFDWEGNGFRLVGEASNGKNALPWIERNEVDILITDIAMPVMDGLELIRTARERCPQMKFILLSRHSDFAYVREGMRMGASDYLLKPTLEPADLKEVLAKVVDQITEDRKINELYAKQELSGKRLELEKAFAKLLVGEPAPLPWNEELPWLKDGYRIILCLLDGAGHLRSEDGGVFMEIMIEEAQESFYGMAEDGIAFRGGADQLVLVVPEPPVWEEYLKSVLTCFHAALKARGFSFTLGISGKYQGIERFKQAITEGRHAVKRRFYEGPGGIYPYMTDCGGAAGIEESKLLLSRFKASLRDAEKEQALRDLEGLFRRWSSHRPAPLQVKREAQEPLTLFHLLKDNRTVPIEQIEALRYIETVEEVKGWIRAAFEALWKPEEETEEESGFHRRIVGRAIDYLKHHYTQNISLQEVADHVAMSKNYFSELFKKDTGQNFIDYLIRLRLKRACELLRTTTLKVYEVAEMSGFNDVKYFGKVFKKVMRMSPAEYREKAE